MIIITIDNIILCIITIITTLLMLNIERLPRQSFDWEKLSPAGQAISKRLRCVFVSIWSESWLHLINLHCLLLHLINFLFDLLLAHAQVHKYENYLQVLLEQQTKMLHTDHHLMLVIKVQSLLSMRMDI